jgi:hypothetical protein
LVRILPLVGKYPCSALKGGKAINLFYRDMPRLSVAIDLVYVPIGQRAQSLDEMTQSLKNIGDARIQYSPLNRREREPVDCGGWQNGGKDRTVAGIAGDCIGTCCHADKSDS